MKFNYKQLKELERESRKVIKEFVIQVIKNIKLFINDLMNEKEKPRYKAKKDKYQKSYKDYNN